MELVNYDPLRSPLLSFNEYVDQIKHSLHNDANLNELFKYTDFIMTTLQKILTETNQTMAFYNNHAILQHVITNSICIDKTPKIILYVLQYSPSHIIELLIQKLIDNDSLDNINNRMNAIMFENLTYEVIKLLHTSVLISKGITYEPKDEDFHAVFIRSDELPEKELLLNYLLELTNNINKYPQIMNLACRYGTPNMIISLINKGVAVDKFTHDYITLIDYRYGYPGTLIMKYRTFNDKMELLPIILDQVLSKEELKLIIYNEYLAYACKTQCEQVIQLIVKYLGKENPAFIQKVLCMKYLDKSIIQHLKLNEQVSKITIESINKLTASELNIWTILRTIGTAPIIVTQAFMSTTSTSQINQNKKQIINNNKKCTIL
jgi:hypothetical protein